MMKVDVKKVIGELVETLKWCSGSADFGPGGQAYGGWQKGPLLAISLGNRVLKAMPDGVMVELEQTEAEKEEERVYRETHPPAPEEKKDPSIFATMTAATAWCKPETEKIQLDPILAKAFAEVIDEIIRPHPANL